MTGTLVLFGLSAGAVIIVPGPTTLLAMNNGSTGGLRLAAFGVAGAALSDLLLIAATALGLGALFTASVGAFAALKAFGVLYLVWLAWQLWRHEPPVGQQAAGPIAGHAAEHTSGPAPRSRAHAFAHSLLIALSNPKGWLFFCAFLPQFIDARQPLTPQYLRAALLFTLIDVVLMGVYALVGVRATRTLSRRGVHLLHRGAALVLVFLAASLFLYRQPGI